MFTSTPVRGRWTTRLVKRSEAKHPGLCEFTGRTVPVHELKVCCHLINIIHRNDFFPGSSCLCVCPRGDGLPGGPRTHWEVGKRRHPVSAKLNTSISLKHAFWIAAVFRLTRDSPSFKDELDIMKFICKDFWTKVFRRQVDNLRTNHQVNEQGSRAKCCWTTEWWNPPPAPLLICKQKIPLLPQGTYVLQDNKFCLLTQLSNGKQYLDQAPKVYFQFLLHTAVIDLSETQQFFSLNVQRKYIFVCCLL